MTINNYFDILLLIARPGAGKSEIIDYLKHIPVAERIQRFHVGEIREFDDFPILWGWFEEDYLLNRMGHPRLHTDEGGYFLHQYFWDELVENLCFQYEKMIKNGEQSGTTALMEFSRGSEHGGYTSAFAHLSRLVLSRASILYIDVSWEESLRKNRKRFNPNKPDSILEHSLPDEKLARLYRETDFHEIAKQNPEYLSIQGINVPYVIFDNQDDVTTDRGAELGVRLEDCLNCLWLRNTTRS